MMKSEVERFRVTYTSALAIVDGIVRSVSCKTAFRILQEIVEVQFFGVSRLAELGVGAAADRRR